MAPLHLPAILLDRVPEVSNAFINYSHLTKMSISNSLPTTLDLSDELSRVSDLDSAIENGSHVCSEVNETPKNNSKISRCIITFFNETPTIQHIEPDLYFGDASRQTVRNWCGQFEICPLTKKKHAHVYAEFHRDSRGDYRPLFDRLRQLFNSYHYSVNIRVPKRVSNKQRQCGVNYCLKPDSRLSDPEIQIIWKHNAHPLRFDQSLWEKKANASSKSAKVDKTKTRVEWIDSKPVDWTWNQIVHECDESKFLLADCSWGKKYHNGRSACASRRTITNFIIMYGAGGTGKTTCALSYDEQTGESKQARYYKRNTDDGNFWGGGQTAYRGQRIIHFEEFNGGEAFHKFKEYVDIGKEGPQVSIKGSGVQLNHETVIATSNIHPAGWYHSYWKKDPKQFHPFWRRVTEIRFYPANRPDGSLNIPDPLNPPYYVDQTAEWKDMQGDYQACLDHSDQYWPVESFEGRDAFTRSFNPPSRGFDWTFSNKPM